MCPAVDDGSVQEVMQPCSKLKKSSPVHVILKTDKWDYLGGSKKVFWHQVRYLYPWEVES